MKKQKKGGYKKTSFVSLEEAVHTMRISPLQLENWIQEGKIHPLLTSKGLSLPETVFKKLAHSPEVFAATIQAAASESLHRQDDDVSGVSKEFEAQISQLIVEYRTYVDTLQNIHSKYKEAYNIIRNQSSDAAAYIIFSRVISLLRMTCLCLENKYWESLVLLRPIDEALQLAEFFVISADTPEGKKYLNEWFRENKSPSNSVCRDAIDKFSRSLSPSFDDDNLGDAMRQIYQAKSKPIHNAFNNIMEVYRTHMEDGHLIGDGFDYGPCSYSRKILRLLHFFRSSIWTTVQIFLICIRFSKIQIDSTDIQTLEALNQHFLKEINRGHDL